MNIPRIDRISRGGDIILYDALNGLVDPKTCNESYVKGVIDEHFDEVDGQTMLMIPDHGALDINVLKDSPTQELINPMLALVLAKASNTIELVEQMHPADQMMFFYHIQRFLYVNLHGGMASRDHQYMIYRSADYVACMEVVAKMDSLELLQELNNAAEKIRDKMAKCLEGRGYKVLKVAQDVASLITKGMCDSWQKVKGVQGSYVCKVKPTDRRVKREFRVQEHENLVPEQIIYTGDEVVTIAPDLSGHRDYEDMRDELSGFERIQVVKCAAKGAKALHDKGFVHLDVKPSNLMVFRDPDDNRVSAKLTDFETSEKIGNDKIHRLTFYYSEKDFSMPHYYFKADTAADCYGIGCMIIDEIVGREAREDFSMKVIPALVEAFVEDGRQIDGARLMGDSMPELEAKRRYLSMGIMMVNITLNKEGEGLEEFNEYYLEHYRRAFDLDSFLPFEAVDFLLRTISLVRSERPSMDEVIEFLDKYGEILACIGGKC